MRRNVLISGILAGTIGAAGLGWVAGRTVRSPGQIAAKTAPPSPSLITVAVEKRQLSADVIARGTVRHGALQPVTLIPSTVKSAQDILTVAPTPGATVTEGKSAMTVSGRPVFVLKGAVPTYRDLAPGTSGEDVRQLQAALVRLGFNPGPVTGTYDANTAAAVGRWYTASGFTPFGATPQQLKALQSSQAAVSKAQSAAFKAQAALDAVKGTPVTVVKAESARRSAAAALFGATLMAAADKALGALGVQAKVLAASTAAVDQAAAARVLAAAQSGLDPATGLPAFTPEQQTQLQTAVYRAQRDVGVAQADLVAANQVAVANQQADAAAIESASAGLDQARATLAADQATLDSDRRDCAAKSTSPACGRISADQRQVATDNTAVRVAQAGLSAAQASAAKDAATATADIDAKNAAVSTANDALAAAQRHLSAAQQGLDPATGQPRLTPIALADLADKVARMTNAAAQAQSDVGMARQTAASTEQHDMGLIAADRDALAVSDAQLAQAHSPISSALAQERARLAAADLGHATTALAEVNRSIGVTVPADELLFFPALPLRVDTVKLKTGDAVSSEVMRVSTARLVVDSALSLADATLVRVGSLVRVEEPNLGITVTGRVTLVGAAPGTNGVDPQHVYLEVTPDQAPLQLVGASVKLTISVKSTRGQVLVVPASALSVASDGTSRVQVERGGRTTFVTVVPGLGAQGLVEVRAVGAPLSPGDRVVVGPAGVSAAPLPGPITTTSAGTGTSTTTSTTTARVAHGSTTTAKPPGG
ncbi:MAG: peptidoglycan-binding protein [Acidimicrobiales bacterium]